MKRSGLETRVKTDTDKDGQTIQLYCPRCDTILSEEFYTHGGASQLLGVRDCDHYEWVFVGESSLNPPWDEETKEIVNKSLGKVNANYGKYFLLPKRRQRTPLMNTNE